MSKPEKNEPEAKAYAPKIDPPKESKAGIPGLAIGRTVHYHKSIATSSGSKLITQAAIIAAISEGNFQAKDGAADLAVLTTQGGVWDHKFGVMYSPEPAQNRWTFIKDK